MLACPRSGAAVSAFLLIACGGASQDGLFSAGTSGAGGAHQAPWETGGVGGGFFASGGAAFGAGGTSGAGGLANTGGGPPMACDFGGTWASYIVAPVTWPATPSVLFSGVGNLQQWNLSHQRMSGLLDVDVDTVPCGIFLPDLQSDVLGGYAKFGIRFPENIFDDGDVPTTRFVLRGKIDGATMTYTTAPFAIVLGAVLQDPVRDAWPTAAGLNLVDHDLDQKPGITVVAAPGNGYSFPPCDLGTCRADLIFIAERTVSSLEGTVISCDEVRSAVTIQTVDGQPGINSTVVGCRNATDSSDCTPDNANFINANRPQYTPSAKGTMVTVRMPDGATCKDVRARFPKQ